MSDIIYLMSEQTQTDDMLIERTYMLQKQVFAEVSSISASEFHSSRQNGLMPEYKFNVFFGDYDGEKIIMYNNEYYNIYRTYRNGDIVELYAEGKNGI